MCKLMADFGSNKVFVWNTDRHIDTAEELTPAEFLDLPKRLEPGTRLIVENAHMAVARSKYSRAQFFTKKELEQFSQDGRSLDIELFCEQQTGRARNDAGLVHKDDKNDMLAMHLLTEKYPHVALKKMPMSLEPSLVRQEGQGFKDDTTNILNITRGGGDNAYTSQDDKLSLFLINHLEEIGQQLSDETKDVFRLTDDHRYKRDCTTGKAGTFKLGGVCLSQIYSIASLLMDCDGNPRLRESTGKLAGWNFIRRHVLRMSPYHRRGGVARSNLYYHGIRHYIAPRIAQTIYDSIDLDTVSIETLSERFDPPLSSMADKKKTKRLSDYTSEWATMDKKDKKKTLLPRITKAMKGKKRGRKRDANLCIIEGSDFTKEEEREFLHHRKTYSKAMQELFFVIKKCVRSSNYQSAA